MPKHRPECSGVPFVPGLAAGSKSSSLQTPLPFPLLSPPAEVMLALGGQDAVSQTSPGLCCNTEIAPLAFSTLEEAGVYGTEQLLLRKYLCGRGVCMGYMYGCIQIELLALDSGGN